MKESKPKMVNSPAGYTGGQDEAARGLSSTRLICPLLTASVTCLCPTSCSAAPCLAVPANALSEGITGILDPLALVEGPSASTLSSRDDLINNDSRIRLMLRITSILKGGQVVSGLWLI